MSDFPSDEGAVDFGVFPFEEEMWDALLGRPPRPYDESNRVEYARKGPCPEQNEGPLDGVPLHRWLATRAVEEAGKVRLPASVEPGSYEAAGLLDDAHVEAARGVRERLRQELIAGTLVAFAIHPETGVEFPIPKAAWQATGNAIRELWWSGRYQVGGGLAGDVFLRTLPPAWWPREKQSLKAWCGRGGAAEKVAVERMRAAGRAYSEKAICEELFRMWREAGRTGSSPKSIETTRAKTG